MAMSPLPAFYALSAPSSGKGRSWATVSLRDTVAADGNEREMVLITTTSSASLNIDAARQAAAAERSAAGGRSRRSRRIRLSKWTT
jgi:hypothetical protein